RTGRPRRRRDAWHPGRARGSRGPEALAPALWSGSRGHRRDDPPSLAPAGARARAGGERRLGPRPRRREELAHLRDERVDVERLAHDLALSLCGDRVRCALRRGGEKEHGDVGPAHVATEYVEYVDAVEAGKGDVEDQQVGWLALLTLEDQSAVRDVLAADPESLPEDGRDQRRGIRVVLSDEDPGHTRSRSRRRRKRRSFVQSLHWHMRALLSNARASGGLTAADQSCPLGRGVPAGRSVARGVARGAVDASGCGVSRPRGLACSDGALARVERLTRKAHRRGAGRPPSNDERERRDGERGSEDGPRRHEPPRSRREHDGSLGEEPRSQLGAERLAHDGALEDPATLTPAHASASRDGMSVRSISSARNWIPRTVPSRLPTRLAISDVL